MNRSFKGKDQRSPSKEVVVEALMYNNFTIIGFAVTFFISPHKSLKKIKNGKRNQVSPLSYGSPQSGEIEVIGGLAMADFQLKKNNLIYEPHTYKFRGIILSVCSSHDVHHGGRAHWAERELHS